MSRKPAVLRQRAEQDIDEALAHWLDQGGPALAGRFIDALQQALEHLSAHPGSASPRWGHELGLPGLRAWPLTRFPYLIFFVERPGHLDVWRVLHQRRDLPQGLLDDEPNLPDTD